MGIDDHQAGPALSAGAVSCCKGTYWVPEVPSIVEKAGSLTQDHFTV